MAVTASAATADTIDSTITPSRRKGHAQSYKRTPNPSLPWAATENNPEPKEDSNKLKLKEFEVLAEEAFGSNELEENIPEEAGNEDHLFLDETDSVQSVMGETFSDYLKAIGQYSILTAEEEIELAKRIEQGDKEALNTMVEHNLRLVVSVAKRYSWSNMPIVDLVQEGSIGLMRAAKDFDYRKGYKFSTYATWWIRQVISRYIANSSREIRVPVHMVGKIGELRKAQNALFQELQKDPSDTELARYMGKTVEEIHKIKEYQQDVVSLNMSLGDEHEGSEVGDFIEDKNQKSPEDQAFDNAMIEAVQDILKDLTDREQFVLTQRFGLNGESPHTLDEIGRMMHITRERVRQIEVKAIRKLKHPRRMSRLKDFA